MGECSETSRCAIGGSDWDRIMRGRPHAQERAKAEGEKPAAIHWRMVIVYGKKCVSGKSVRKWSARFRAGRESVVDDQRPGQANTVITRDLIDKVDNLVRSDRRVTLQMMAL
ncbi:HTH_48 domain-containing protein [Trichonephila inaurata madagascariensis]|uniref:HTH_48 domain-containing protein n=1 Tax=Trichonephila inaurata madagascariensis TaxID=2747483 RepID=A0A8X6XQ45_9ARAC|nr:HTH_48 domain-containing protein [Trichonephila inaurata madagascariensis]